MTTKIYDVIIAGSGIAGSMLALLISENENLNILVLDKAKAQIPTSIMVSALTQATIDVLQYLNAYESFTKTPYNTMQIYDKTATGFLEFNASNILRDNLGVIANNNEVKQVLHDKIKETKNITMIFEQAIQSANLFENWHITTDKDKFEGKMLVAADGANSKIRELLNWEISKKKYINNAVIMQVATINAPKATCLQNFNENGIFALLPIDDNKQFVCVYSDDDFYIEKLKSLKEEELCKTLNNDFVRKLNFTIDKAHSLQDYKLVARQINKYTTDKLAFVADAAHTINPLAGLGLNSGVLDVAVLADIILKNPHNFYHKDILQKLEKRKFHQLAISTLMKSIESGFHSDNSYIRLIRNVVLDTTNKLDFVKNRLIDEASMLKYLPKRFKRVM